MAEGQLVRAVAGREAEELVTEADAEDGHAAERVAHDLVSACERLRVAGAVREDDAVEASRARRPTSCAGRRSRPRRLGEAAHDRPLGAVVDDGDVRRARLGEDVRLRRRDLRRRAPGPPSPAARAPARAHRPPEARLRRRRPRRAWRPRRAGAGRASACRSRRGRRGRARAASRPLLAAERAHERRLRVRLGRLAALVGDAVVADHRRREADELARVARVGDGLLVAGHARS